MFFCGRIGPAELDAVSLANTVYLKINKKKIFLSFMKILNTKIKSKVN